MRYIVLIGLGIFVVVGGLLGLCLMLAALPFSLSLFLIAWYCSINHPSARFARSHHGIAIKT
ncbi:MAG: hypothetical protein PHY34_05655 [Patescibacteria group bacterium]|nr:hypothetical protein [Patescibacteria group bacterium]MDD5715722.1 hypothetical protein [Patescibacteria group bacterium]